jgi:hypothetical protein
MVESGLGQAVVPSFAALTGTRWRVQLRALTPRVALDYAIVTPQRSPRQRRTDRLRGLPAGGGARRANHEKSRRQLPGGGLPGIQRRDLVLAAGHFQPGDNRTGVFTGPWTTPTGALNTTVSNSLTIWPGPKEPRLPPSREDGAAGVFLGQLSEVGTVLDGGLQFVSLGFGGDEDVTGGGLCHLMAPCGLELGRGRVTHSADWRWNG